MIQRRLVRLSFPARNLLAAGAILGQNFTFEEICQVAQLPLQDGLAALDEALPSLLLREPSHQREGRGGISYHFAHDKIREVVYAAAGDARRRVFHSQAFGSGVREHPHPSASLPRTLKGDRQLLRFGGRKLRMSKKEYYSG
jgi:predicted ATPase